MAPTNKYNKIGHWALGFGLQFVNGLLYSNFREDRQLPPENDAKPQLWVNLNGLNEYGHVTAWKFYEELRDVAAYWSAVRVLDILSDLTEVIQGATVGWFFEKALWLWLGYKLAGWIG